MNEYAGTVMKNINVNIHALEKIPEIQSGDDLGSIIIAALETDGSIVTETSTDILTNKTIDGTTNTLQNIANASLTNSSIGIGGVTLN